MKKYPLPKFIYDRKKQSTKKIPGTIEVAVSFQRKTKYFSTGIKVLPTEWKGNKIVGRDDADDLNLKISGTINNINDYINNLILQREDFIWEDFEAFLVSNGKRYGNRGSFIDFVDTTIDTKTNLGKRTRDNHRKLVTSLKAFGKIKTFNDLTPANIDAYDKWLHERGYKQATIGSYHKFLKIYIHDAIRLQIIDRSPYVGFKVDHGKPAIRKYLTPEELENLETVELSNPTYEKIKDLFIFQVYTGLAYVDLKKFDFQKVIKRDGKYVIHDVRQKTGQDFYIVLLSKAVNVLQKYDFKLPLITLEQYNMRLKIVAGEAKIKKDLTSHMARHTYASIALNHGIPIEVLKEMMGHSDIRTTQIYAKMFNKTVEDSYDILEKKILNIKK